MTSRTRPAEIGFLGSVGEERPDEFGDGDLLGWGRFRRARQQLVDDEPDPGQQQDGREAGQPHDWARAAFLIVLVDGTSAPRGSIGPSADRGLVGTGVGILWIRDHRRVGPGDPRRCGEAGARRWRGSIAAPGGAGAGCPCRASGGLRRLEGVGHRGRGGEAVDRLCGQRLARDRGEVGR